ncbi:MAG: hypothetical protein FWC41_09490 [Firmicutes bacterium]|nr:hypothetical protein [Bacillota bacterium]
MKKILVTISLFFAVNYFTVNVFAETGIEVLKAAATAMNYEKYKEFNTLQIRATLYVTVGGQNQRVGMRVMSKGDDLLRFEQTFMGKDEVYVITEDAFFKLKPVFQEMDKTDAEYVQIVSFLSMMLPTSMFAMIDSLDEEKVIVELLDNEKFQGKNAKKVRIAPKELPANAPAEAAEGQTFYFDAMTNWFLGMDATPKVSLVFESMKRLKGFVYPTVIKVMVEGKKQQEIEINKMEADIELSDSLFARP